MNAPRPPSRSARQEAWRRAELAALDFEATGLDLDRDTIISFGIVPIVDGRIEIRRAVYELVDPGPVAPTPSSIVIHGLRPVDLDGAPPLEAARRRLVEMLDRRWLVTWWAEVEAGFLAKIFGTSTRSWRRRSIDVRRLAIGWEGDAAARRTLSETAERYGVPVASPHHALDDALVTAQLFLVLATKLASRGIVSMGQLRGVGAEPPVLRRPRAPW